MKKAQKNKKRKPSTFRVATLLILVILFGIVIVVLPATQTNKNSYGATIPFTPIPAKSDLQLETFTLPTSPSPTFVPQTTDVPTIFSAPTRTEVSNPSAPNPATCSGYVNSGIPLPSNCTCPDVYIECPYTTSDPTDVTVGPNGCEDPLFVGNPPKIGKFCIDKPIIYLYPTTPTIVNVAVQTTGSVVVSNPQYPQGGWQNILANPDGTLQYQGKQYSELFYETSVTTFQKPTAGITISSDQLPKELNSILDQLGLVSHEKQEFLEYWVPRLQTLNSPYIFFSLLDSSAKQRVDAVNISPKPETMIDFIAYFKPITAEDNGPTLQLPKAPARKGFVAVEWGGVIDK